MECSCQCIFNFWQTRLETKIFWRNLDIYKKRKKALKKCKQLYSNVHSADVTVCLPIKRSVNKWGWLFYILVQTSTHSVTDLYLIVSQHYSIWHIKCCHYIYSLTLSKQLQLQEHFLYLFTSAHRFWHLSCSIPSFLAHVSYCIFWFS